MSVQRELKKSQSESDLYSDQLKQVKKGHWKFRQTLSVASSATEHLVISFY